MLTDFDAIVDGDPFFGTGCLFGCQDGFAYANVVWHDSGTPGTFAMHVYTGALLYRGNWSGGTEYHLGDAALYADGVWYRALTTTQGVAPPSADWVAVDKLDWVFAFNPHPSGGLLISGFQVAGTNDPTFSPATGSSAGFNDGDTALVTLTADAAVLYSHAFTAPVPVPVDPTGGPGDGTPGGTGSKKRPVSRKTVKLPNYKLKKGQRFPASVSYGDGVTSWPLYKNDVYGDCGPAAAGHMTQVWRDEAGDDFTPTLASVVAMYTGTPDGKLNTPRYDKDIMEYWKTRGLGGDRIYGYAVLDGSPPARDQFKEAVYLFGGCTLQIDLPNSIKTQTVWTKAGGANGKKGSYGGHFVSVYGYSPQYVNFVSWGFPFACDWSFFDAYCNEAYIALHPAWVKAAKTDLGSEYDLEHLKRDMARL